MWSVSQILNVPNVISCTAKVPQYKKEVRGYVIALLWRWHRGSSYNIDTTHYKAINSLSVLEFTSSLQLVQLQFKNYICTQWLKFPIRRTAQMFDGILVADKLHPFQYYEAPKVIDPLSDLHKEKKHQGHVQDSATEPVNVHTPES